MQLTEAVKKQICVCSFHECHFKPRQVMIAIATISNNKYNFTSLWMAFSKNSYLHPSPGFGVWLNISVYIMQTVPSRQAWRDRFKTSPWNYSPNQPPRFLEARIAGTQFLSLQQFRPNTFSLKRGPCGSFEANNAGKKTIFQLFSEVDFLHSRRFQRRNARDGVCYVPRGSSRGGWKPFP